MDPEFPNEETDHQATILDNFKRVVQFQVDNVDIFGEDPDITVPDLEFVC